jgi:hypothetical protein
MGRALVADIHGVAKEHTTTSSRVGMWEDRHDATGDNDKAWDNDAPALSGIAFPPRYRSDGAKCAFFYSCKPCSTFGTIALVSTIVLYLL